MKKLLVLLVLLFTVNIVYASTSQITLLTVGEIENRTFGGTANLQLEIRPGTGRVFIDSFPLTQLDTQISTRFGKEVACNFLDVDCSNHDFFYTIRATSALVGGPSAGAATTILTISVLDGVSLNKNVVMTGTINSGGIIGPVSGIKAKTIAAKNAGFDMVLLPKWSVLDMQDENVTYADSLVVEGIDIQVVSDIEEALWFFTNKDYSRLVGEIEVPFQYTQIMGQISGDLCNRHYEMFPLGFNESQDALNDAELAMQRGDFYSAASFCFGANVAARAYLFQNLTDEEKQTIFEDLKAEFEEFSSEIYAKELNTFSDLEASVIVKERLFETKNLLERDNALDNLAYISERFYSAIAWSRFFDYDSTSLDLDTNYLNSACSTKIAEVEERLSYLQFIAGTTGRFSEELTSVRGIANDGDFAFCLFRATRIKADINALLLTAMVREDSYVDLAQDKLDIAYKQIYNAKEFSILGYSYFDYANSLINQNPELSIIFSEYAAEFTNLDMYFPSGSSPSMFLFVRNPYFVLGLFVGILISFLALLLALVFINYKPRKAKSSPGKKR
ncbi:MAG: S16 family serine protease [Candidatus Woesearchaeota archaeon]